MTAKLSALPLLLRETVASTDAEVERAAQKTDGYQRNDNLLLSDQVRADSIPGLEIE